MEACRFDTHLSSSLDCARTVTLGISSLATALVSVAALRRMYVVFSASGGRRFGLNCVMVFFALCQTSCSTLLFFLDTDERIAIAARYFRGLQMLLACLVYTRLACEAMDKMYLVGKVLLPGLSFIFVYLSVIFIVAMFTDEIDCHHPAELLMSISMVAVAACFTTAGYFVMRVINQATSKSVHQDTLMGPEQGELVQKRKQLWSLLLVNVASSIFLIVFDVYRLSIYDPNGECQIVPEGDESAVVQLLRFCMRMIAFLIPVWNTLYVFWYIERRQFTTQMDVSLDGYSELDDDILNSEYL